MEEKKRKKHHKLLHKHWLISPHATFPSPSPCWGFVLYTPVKTPQPRSRCGFLALGVKTSHPACALEACAASKRPSGIRGKHALARSLARRRVCDSAPAALTGRSEASHGCRRRSPAFAKPRFPTESSAILFQPFKGFLRQDDVILRRKSPTRLPPPRPFNHLLGPLAIKYCISMVKRNGLRRRECVCGGGRK